MSHENYSWRTGRSQVYKHFYHLVFVTKYRRGVFTKEILHRVHILISIPPKHSVTNVVSKLKGKSSYFIRKEFWDHVKKKLWGEHFWSPSYCSVTCGGAPLEIIKKYIDNHRQPPSEKGVAQSIRERNVCVVTMFGGKTPLFKSQSLSFHI